MRVKQVRARTYVPEDVMLRMSAVISWQPRHLGKACRRPDRYVVRWMRRSHCPSTLRTSLHSQDASFIPLCAWSALQGGIHFRSDRVSSNSFYSSATEVALCEVCWPRRTLEAFTVCFIVSSRYELLLQNEDHQRKFVVKKKWQATGRSVCNRLIDNNKWQKVMSIIIATHETDLYQNSTKRLYIYYC